MTIAYNPAFSTSYTPAYNTAGEGGAGQFTPLSLSPSAWYSTRNPANYIANTYISLAQTGSGTQGTHTITASASTITNSLPSVNFGVKLRIGGTDVYTVTGISSTTITVAEALTAPYGAGTALAFLGVTQLNDISGNANHAAVTTATGMPYASTSINGIPGVYAARTINTRWLQITNPIVFTGAYTLFLVVYYIDPGSVAHSIVGSNDAAKGTQFGVLSGTITLRTAFSDAGSGGGTTPYPSNNAAAILMFQRDASDNVWFSVNNGALQSLAGGTTSGDATIGALFHKDSTANQVWNGLGDEFLFYNFATTSANNTAVFGYLNAAFGGIY